MPKLLNTMDSNKIYRIAQKKENNNWINCYETYNETEIYKSLCNDLIAKKINACRYIKSIKRIQNYDSTIKIIVSYDNNTRSVYRIKEF